MACRVVLSHYFFVILRDNAFLRKKLYKQVY